MLIYLTGSAEQPRHRKAQPETENYRQIARLTAVPGEWVYGWLAGQCRLFHRRKDSLMLERFKVPEKDRVYVPEPRIRAATEGIFRHSGVAAEAAASSADVLITNDLRGVESHGRGDAQGVPAALEAPHQGAIGRVELRALRDHRGPSPLALVRRSASLADTRGGYRGVPRWPVGEGQLPRHRQLLPRECLRRVKERN